MPYPLATVVAALVSVAALLAPPAHAQPPAPNWDPRTRTAGVTFKLHRVGDPVAASARASYSIELGGFPSGRTYNFWLHHLNGETVRIFEEMRVTEDGELASAEGLSLGKGKLTFSDMYPGEPMGLAIISTDGVIRAYTRIVPFPIEASDGGCRLSMELLDIEGARFGVVGEGFEPNSTVRILSTSLDERMEAEFLTAADGRFAAFVAPEVNGQTGGAASYRAAGRSCTVTVQYQWGSAMQAR